MFQCFKFGFCNRSKTFQPNIITTNNSKKISEIIIHKTEVSNFDVYKKFEKIELEDNKSRIVLKIYILYQKNKNGKVKNKPPRNNLVDINC